MVTAIFAADVGYSFAEAATSYDFSATNLVLNVLHGQGTLTRVDVVPPYFEAVDIEVTPGLYYTDYRLVPEQGSKYDFSVSGQFDVTIEHHAWSGYNPLLPTAVFEVDWLVLDLDGLIGQPEGYDYPSVDGRLVGSIFDGSDGPCAHAFSYNPDTYCTGYQYGPKSEYTGSFDGETMELEAEFSKLRNTSTLDEPYSYYTLSLVATTAVPIPAASWMFVAALGLLGTLNRRNASDNGPISMQLRRP